MLCAQAKWADGSLLVRNSMPQTNSFSPEHTQAMMLGRGQGGGGAKASPPVQGPVSLVRKFEVYLYGGSRELLKKVTWSDIG